MPARHREHRDTANNLQSQQFKKFIIFQEVYEFSNSAFTRSQTSLIFLVIRRLSYKKLEQYLILLEKFVHKNLRNTYIFIYIFFI